MGGSERRTKARAILVALGLAAAVVAALLITAGPATAKQFATLHLLEGGAEIRTAGASAFQDAEDQATLRVGDTVRTGPDGRAEIAYFDGSVTRLDYGTEFTLQELSSSQDAKAIVGEQGSGNTFSRVVELTGSESRFEVGTPTATASVRGTAFAIRLRADGGSDVWVIHGVVAAVLPDGSSVRIKAGEGLTVQSDGSHADVYILTDEMLSQDWLNYNLCQLEGSSTCPEQVLGIEITNPGEPVAEEATGGTVVLAGTTTTTTSSGGGNGSGGGGPAPQPQPTEPPPPPPPPPPDPPPTTPPPDQRHGCEVSQSHGQGNQNPSCGPDGPGGGNGKGNGPKN